MLYLVQRFRLVFASEAGRRVKSKSWGFTPDYLSRVDQGGLLVLSFLPIVFTLAKTQLAKLHAWLSAYSKRAIFSYQKLMAIKFYKCKQL